MLWLNLLSLDAPLIAVTWQLLFAHALRIQIRPATTFILAAAVWIIYVTDRLMDAQHPDAALQPGRRHQFYLKYGRWFYLPVILAGAACFAALPQVPAFVVRDGLVIVLAVVLYLASVHLALGRAQRYFPKEYASAAIFAAGVTLPFWARLTHSDPVELTAIALFCGVCFANTVAIEYWESAASGRVVATTPTVWLGPRVAYATALLAVISLVFIRDSELFEAECLSACCLTAVAAARSYLRTDVACALIDASLLLPALPFLALS